MSKAAVTGTGAVAAASSAAGTASVASAERPVWSRASPRSAPRRAGSRRMRSATGGERDGGAEGRGAGGRGRMSMRDGGGERGLVGGPGGVAGPEKPEDGRPGGGSGGVGSSGSPPRDTGPKHPLRVQRGHARPADLGGGQPGGEAQGMIVDAGQHRVRRDQGQAAVGPRG